MKREPFPLQWPDGVRRTAVQTRSKFGYRQSGQVPFSQARRDLLDELERLGAANVVITTDLPVRGDGLPYATSRQTGETGVAVWFILADERGNHHERVFACDKWTTHAENMTAIAKSIEAMRGLARWGVNEMLERMFTGFTALPAGDGSEYVPPPPPPARRPWREVLGPGNVGWPEGLDGDELLAIAKSRYRKLVKLKHPDVGGDDAAAAELNEAMAEAERELAGGGA